MSIFKPSRPGDMVANMIKELEITVTDAAEHLGVSRQTLNNLINNKSASVSPEMAMRLEAVFGSTADNWLRMQAGYDAYIVRRQQKKITKNLKRFMPQDKKFATG